MSSLSLRKSFNAAHTALCVLSTCHILIAYISFDAWITAHVSAISQDEMIPFELNDWGAPLFPKIRLSACAQRRRARIARPTTESFPGLHSIASTFV